MRPNMTDAALYAGDPHPTYRWLRANAPVYWDEATRAWILSRHEDVTNVSKTPDLFSAAQGATYLVLPFFGPSSARDGSGILVDAGIRYAIVSAMNLDTNIGDEWDTIHAGITAMEMIDKRHGESFRYYGSGYPFDYDMVRYLYTKQREFQSVK